MGGEERVFEEMVFEGQVFLLDIWQKPVYRGGKPAEE